MLPHAPAPRARRPVRAHAGSSLWPQTASVRRRGSTRASEEQPMSIVFTEDHGPVRHVVMNRPEKRNAMNQELLRELGGALRAAGDDASVQCVVLRGEGPVFSAGVDLAELG